MNYMQFFHHPLGFISCARATEFIHYTSFSRRVGEEGFCTVAGSSTFWKKKKWVEKETEEKKFSLLPSDAAAAVFLAWVSINMGKYIKATLTFAVFSKVPNKCTCTITKNSFDNSFPWMFYLCLPVLFTWIQKYIPCQPAFAKLNPPIMAVFLLAFMNTSWNGHLTC